MIGCYGSGLGEVWASRSNRLFRVCARGMAGLLVGGMTSVFPSLPAEAQKPELASLADLSIEELADMEITSVSKRSQKLSDAAASIYVITSDDIRRSGATTIPEILRLAPNLQMARIDNVQYAISARGFNNAIGNKLLVLIDGRTIYTPLFSGVFWEMQDTMIEDIDRIEVISGPGATLWGANAVNGVINIITKPASDTRGALLAADAGNEERGFSVRFGGALGDRGSFRVYGNARDWSSTTLANGNDALDEWERGQIGFRADWESVVGEFTLQGNAYSGESQRRGVAQGVDIGELSIAGANLLGGWTRGFDNGSEMRIQAYYDHTDRDDLFAFRPEADIYDIEFQHEIPVDNHIVLWGGGYRHGSDEVDPGIATRFIPDSRSLDWENLFVQDTIGLSERVTTTLGLKLEWNDYTGAEYLPSGRIGWKAANDRLVWAAVSRAVRAPSRFDREVFIPGLLGPPFLVQGGPNFESEVAVVYELGYRAQPSEALSYSVTAFYHDWDKLRSGSGTPLQIDNLIEGEVYGVEAWGSYQPLSFWTLKAGALVLDKDLKFKPGSPANATGIDTVATHNDPAYQWSLQSGFELPHDIQLDLFLRRVDSLNVQPVPGYTELDVRAAWNATNNVEVWITGRNLLHESHPEFGAAATRSENERAVLLGVRVSL